MKCTACGHDNTEDAQFCGGCGVSLSGSTASGIRIGTAELPMVSFPNADKFGFQKYFDFSGRATRAETWWWILFLQLINVGLWIVDEFGGLGLELISLVFFLGILIPSLALGVRRLHDINRTGWWLLLWLGSIFIIPVILLIVWAIKRGDYGPNKYGPDPRQATSQQP